jgi:hypothetical protein
MHTQPQARLPTTTSGQPPVTVGMLTRIVTPTCDVVQEQEGNHRFPYGPNLQEANGEHRQEYRHDLSSRIDSGQRDL